MVYLYGNMCDCMEDLMSRPFIDGRISSRRISSRRLHYAAGEVRSYTLYFPLHRKEGGGTTHYHYHYPNHHSWGPLKTWSCCSPTLLASIFRFDLKKEKQ